MRLVSANLLGMLLAALVFASPVGAVFNDERLKEPIHHG